MPIVNANGLTFSYERHVGGGGDKPPAVLVCGTGQQTSSWTWLGLIETFTSAGHDVISFENRGIQPSSCPPPPWTAEDMADDVIGILNELCDQPVHLLGASLGANIVELVALRRPELVRTAMLLVGGTQSLAGYQPLMRGELECLEEMGRIPAAINLYVNIMSILPPAARADPDQIAAIEALSDSFLEGFGPGGQHGQIAANVSWIDAGESRVAELTRMRVPCLMMAAEHDPFFALADMQRAAALIPDCRLEVLHGSSHVPVGPDTLARLNSVTADFVSTH